MNIKFTEKYEKLSDMKPGDTATSKDRSKFFVCGLHFDTDQQTNLQVILDLNDLGNQYSEKRDMGQPVKILKSGDKFICEE